MDAIKPPAVILVTIIESLRGVVSQQGLCGAFTMICRGFASIEMFSMCLSSRLGRIARRFERLIQRLETEAPRPLPPARNPRGTVPRRAPRPVKLNPHIPAILPPWDPEHPTYAHFRPVAPTPRTFGWLRYVLRHNSAADSQMDYLFLQPGMRALLASDYRFGRILRPLCHMLGMKLPPELRPRQPPAPEPAHEPPDPAMSGPAKPRFCPENATLAPSGAGISLPESHPESRAPPPKPA